MNVSLMPVVIFPEAVERQIRAIIYEHEDVASPLIISPLAMLGFLTLGGTDEEQAIYR